MSKSLTDNTPFCNEGIEFFDVHVLSGQIDTVIQATTVKDAIFFAFDRYAESKLSELVWCKFKGTDMIFLTIDILQTWASLRSEQ